MAAIEPTNVRKIEGIVTDQVAKQKRIAEEKERYNHRRRKN